MSSKSLIIKLRPRYLELRDARTYREADVKNILYAFARDIGCDWPEDELRDFIETVFNFD